MADTKFDEKLVVSTTAVPVSQDGNDDLAAQEAGVAKAKRDIKAAVWAIVTSVALPVIPMIAIGAALLYIIFHHRKEVVPGWPEFITTANTAKEHVHGIKGAYTGYNLWYGKGGGPAYLVDFPPTTITTIAGLASKIMPYLTTSIMGLVAFFAARMLISNSRRGDGEHLPSPEQLTILIGLLHGSGWGPMWDTCAHRFTTKRGLAHPLPLAFTFMFFITLLGFLIPMVDTWFGFATKTTTIMTLSNETVRIPWGLDLNKTMCPNGGGNFSAWYGLEWMPCTLDFESNETGDITAYLKSDDEASRLAAGESAAHMVLNYTMHDTIYHYLAITGVDNTTDFKAKTIAVSAQCTPRTSECLPGRTWPSIENEETYPFFNCSDAFTFNASFPGTVQSLDANQANNGDDFNPDEPMVGIDANFSRRIGAYDENLNDEVASLVFTFDGNDTTMDAQFYANVAKSGLVGTNWSYQYIQPMNPMYFGAWAAGYPTINHIELGNLTLIPEDDTTINPLLNDSQIYRGDNELTHWMLGCEAYVYDVEYTWANGSVHTFNATPSSADMGGMISGPFAFYLAQASLALASAANKARQENASEYLADTFAQEWSKAAVGLSIGALEPNYDYVLIQQDRHEMTVTRVPIIPLFLYLGLKALYVLTVIALAIGAYCFTHPAETEVVKQQLSPKGLADAHFNAPVVRQIQERIDKGKDPKDRKLTTPPATGDEIDPLSAEQPGSSDGVPAALDVRSERRVGLVTRADGAWSFAVKANQTWHTIQPYVKEIRNFESTKDTFGL